MLISHKHKYIFIHIPKTGGSSVSGFLRNNREFAPDIIGHNYLSNDIFPTHNKIFAHDTAIKIKKVFQEDGYDWNQYFKFSIIRNPWDLNVSHYEYWMRYMSTLPLLGDEAKYLKQIQDKTPQQAINDHVLSEDRFLYDEDNNLLVDYVAKLENLDTDMEYILKKINSNASLEKHKMPHVNKTQRLKTDYRDYFTDASKQKVAALNAKTINLGGYKF